MTTWSIWYWKFLTQSDQKGVKWYELTHRMDFWEWKKKQHKHNLLYILYGVAGTYRMPGFTPLSLILSSG